jgi:hypothetical protein
LLGALFVASGGVASRAALVGKVGHGHELSVELLQGRAEVGLVGRRRERCEVHAVVAAGRRRR